MISEEIRILILKSDEASAAMGKLKFMCQATIVEVVTKNLMRATLVV